MPWNRTPRPSWAEHLPPSSRGPAARRAAVAVLTADTLEQVEPAVGPAGRQNFGPPVVVRVPNFNIPTDERLRHRGNDLSSPALGQLGQVRQLLGAADRSGATNDDHETNQTSYQVAHRDSAFVVALRTAVGNQSS